VNSIHLAIGADHAGFALKEELKEHLLRSGHRVMDVGTSNHDAVDYPDIAADVAKLILGGHAARGIVLCGSGVGVSVAANKFQGIRAGLCHDTYSAHQGVEHDNMNVLVLGARVIGPELAKDLVHAFLNAQYGAEPRHARRLEKIARIEQEQCGQA